LHRIVPIDLSILENPMLQRLATTTAKAATTASLTALTAATASLTALTSLAGAAALLAAVPSVAHAGTGAATTGAVDLPTLLAARDSLAVTVRGAGAGVDGSYRLVCAPGGTPDGEGGTHPNASGACAKLEELAAEGQDPFAAPQQDAVCTMIYGGQATARVTGTWQGRQVSADFGRLDGCAIGRWNALVPVLPSVDAAAAR
jgi:hypothetical protein